MCDSNSIDDLEECPPKVFAVMHTVHADEPEQGRFELPDPRSSLFNPVPGHRKVTVGIRCLPGIACEIHNAGYCVTLKEHMS